MCAECDAAASVSFLRTGEGTTRRDEGASVKGCAACVAQSAELFVRAAVKGDTNNVRSAESVLVCG